MRQKMSKDARQELLRSLQPQYRKASWQQKRKLLDGLVVATGHDRKYAVSLLNRHAAKSESSTRQRKRAYADVQSELVQLWNAGNRICSKRLIPFLPALIDSMQYHGHINVSDEQRQKLLSISPATMDRLLKPERAKYGRGKSRTRPGYLIKKRIAVRTFSDWTETRPGFFEADLVAHGGESAHGQFLHTLTLVDIASTWTECFALLRRSEADVMNGLAELRKVLPFPLLGLDTDNGGEFINYTLLNWCEQENITFTRSREYKKNDQAHVEERNGSVVRRLVGYDRYEGVESWRLLASIYRLSREFVNFFQPSMKLITKSRDGAKVQRQYDRAQTPLQRLQKNDLLSQDDKEKLQRQFQLIDPVKLLAEIESLQKQFWSTAIDPMPVCLPVIKNEKKKPESINVPKRKRRRDGSKKNVRVWRSPGSGNKTDVDEVWEDVSQVLTLSPELTATQLLRQMQERYPGRFKETQLNTIRARLEHWRITNHPNVIFEEHKPGRKTSLTDLWPEIRHELENEPGITVRRLIKIFHDRYPDRVRLTQRSTLSNMIKSWRKEHIESITILEHHSEREYKNTPLLRDRESLDHL
jgi:hypothetical protein